MPSIGMGSFCKLFLIGLFQRLVSLKMTEIFLAWVPASFGCHWECQADHFKSNVSSFLVVCGRDRGSEQDREEEKNETRMERRRDRGAEGQKEQVVRREGLMSNERFTRPQLILSLYLCFGVPLSTKVITTPSSIILLSLLFTGNCLIICYRFVLLRIILSVICSISSGKHTAPFLLDALWGLSWVTPSGCSQNLEHHFFPGIKWNYPDLSVIAKSTTNHSGPKQRWNRFLSASTNESTCKFMLMRAFCDPSSPLGAEQGLQGMIIWLLSALDNLYFILM